MNITILSKQVLAVVLCGSLLGFATQSVAYGATKAMAAFNPDSTWHPVE